MWFKRKNLAINLIFRGIVREGTIMTDYTSSGLEFKSPDLKFYENRVKTFKAWSTQIQPDSIYERHSWASNNLSQIKLESIFYLFLFFLLASILQSLKHESDHFHFYLLLKGKTTPFYLYWLDMIKLLYIKKIQIKENPNFTVISNL